MKRTEGSGEVPKLTSSPRQENIRRFSDSSGGSWAPPRNNSIDIDGIGGATKAGPPSTANKMRLLSVRNVDVEYGSEGGKSNKKQIFGGSLYSKALLRGSKSAGDSVEYSDALKYLEGTQYLFFRKCKTFPPELHSFKPRNKRGIWNSSGRAVYYTGETSCYCCRLFHSGFTHEVVDYAGQFVILSQGRQVIFGLKSEVEIYLEGGKLLGSMHQSFLSSTYKIKDCYGRVIYKIQAPCFAPCAPFVFWCCKEHFEICMDDGVTEIGKITKYWDSDVTVEEFQSCLGIEMERVDDVRVKALFLGCFFLIEFQYFRMGGNGPIYFILMILIFACIVLGSECAGYCPLWRDKLGLHKHSG